MIVFEKVIETNREVQAAIRWADAEVFPDDRPVTFNGSTWFVGVEVEDTTSHIPFSWAERIVAYAAWRPHYTMYSAGELHWPAPMGFLYRSGVLPKFRGKGYQKKLITLREEDMKLQGVKKSLTYTDTESIASMKSLIASGYKPYKTDVTTNLAGEGRAKQFVHWEKDL